MPRNRKNDDDFDEDDEDEDVPFNFMDFFSNPEKMFQSKQFKHVFNDIFKKIVNHLPPEFKEISPKDIQNVWKNLKDNPNFAAFKGPFMAGFNVNIGPDGKPIINSFGNIKQKPHSGKPIVKEAREPLVEVLEEGDHIVIIAEMPGVTKEDIEIKASTRSLTISTETTHMGRKYFKEIDLPAAINPDIKSKARYANGILEVSLRKSSEEEKSTNIKIE